MSKIVVKQIRSTIARPGNQVRIIKALKLGRINRIVELKDTPSVRGMLEKVKHLIEIVEQ